MTDTKANQELRKKILKKGVTFADGGLLKSKTMAQKDLTALEHSFEGQNEPETAVKIKPNKDDGQDTPDAGSPDTGLLKKLAPISKQNSKIRRQQQADRRNSGSGSNAGGKMDSIEFESMLGESMLIKQIFE